MTRDAPELRLSYKMVPNTLQGRSGATLVVQNGSRDVPELCLSNGMGSKTLPGRSGATLVVQNGSEYAARKLRSYACRTKWRPARSGATLVDKMTPGTLRNVERPHYPFCDRIMRFDHPRRVLRFSVKGYNIYDHVTGH